MKTSESIGKIAAALTVAQSEMGTAKKDSTNPFFRSKYADINSVNEAMMPALLKAGIAVLQPPTTFEGRNYIETVLLHTSGEYLSSLNEVVVVKQNDPQSYLAAQTYTRRGALQAFLNIGAEDDDGNIANGRSIVPIKEQIKVVVNEKPANASGVSTTAITPVETPKKVSFRQPKTTDDSL